MTDLLAARTWERPVLRGLAWLRNRSLEKNDLALIRAVLAVWALDLGALAAFLHQYNSPATVCLAGAVLVVLGMAALLEVRHRRRTAIALRVLMLLAVIHLVFLSAASWLAWAPRRGFVVENFALYQVDPFPDGTARFAALSQLPNGQSFLAPIDALVLLKLRNAGPQSKIVRGYKLEAWTGNGWQALCRVPFAPNPPYYLFTPARAREIVLTPLAIKGFEGSLAPRQDRVFWSAWACPQKCDLAATPLRLKLTDRYAREEIVPFPSNRKADGAALPSGLDIGGVLDLDAAKERIYGRDSCARLLGARRGAHTLW